MGGERRGGDLKVMGGARACPPTHNLWLRHL